MKKITKSNEEWQAQLDAEQYRVTRNAGTEAPASAVETRGLPNPAVATDDVLIEVHAAGVTAGQPTVPGQELPK